MNMNENTSKEQAKLQEELLEVMPAVEQANSISESLDKMTKFEMVLVSKWVWVNLIIPVTTERRRAYNRIRD